MVKWNPIHRLLYAGVMLFAAACGSSRPNYSTQTAPPEVAWATTPPAYTVTPSLTISVTATNVMGVGRVYVLVGSERTTAVQQADGTWQAAITLPVVGHNIVTVWAEDKSTPVPNSGQGLEAPYQLAADVNYTATSPSLSYDASFLSYVDERSMQVVLDGNGFAKLPAQYTSGPRVVIPPGGEIFKASTRLSGGAMTASELESTNGGNIPVLRFTVPYNRNVDPPVAAPTYVAHVTCPSCPDFTDATGTMLAAAATDSQRALFDLPLASETIPALAQVMGTATVSIAVTVTDAAGLTTTVPGFNFFVHVIGAPVGFVEDTAYPPSVKPESTYPYHLADNTYATLWSGTTFPNGKVRLLRYIVSNPTMQPIAIRFSYTQDSGGSWRAKESWSLVSGMGVGISTYIGQSNPDLADPSKSIEYQLLDGFK